MSFMSITHPSMPPIKGTVRGETYIAGYVFKPSAKNPKNSDFCILSQVDIKVFHLCWLIVQGAIPKFVVNYVAARQPHEWLLKLQKACERARDSRMGIDTTKGKKKK